MRKKMNTENQIPDWLRKPLRSKQQKFEEVEVLVDLVVSKKAPSFLLTGQPGIGKTRLVKDRFRAAHKLDGLDYRVVKGHGSALGLYNLLYENRQQTLVFDDADSVFQDARGINILKAALDSYDTRIVSWESPMSTKRLDIPSTFDFEGSVIFISNIDEKAMDSAIYSRCLHRNLALTPEEVLAFMYEKVDEIEPDVPIRQKLEVISHLAEHINELSADGDFNLRTLKKAIWLAQSQYKRWKDLALQSA